MRSAEWSSSRRLGQKRRSDLQTCRNEIANIRADLARLYQQHKAKVASKAGGKGSGKGAQKRKRRDANTGATFSALTEAEKDDFQEAWTAYHAVTEQLREEWMFARKCLKVSGCFAPEHPWRSS